MIRQEASSLKVLLLLLFRLYSAPKDMAFDAETFAQPFVLAYVLRWEGAGGVVTRVCNHG